MSSTGQDPNLVFFTLLAMCFHQCCICGFMALFIGFGSTNDEMYQSFGKESGGSYPTIYVDSLGHGNFSTIQSAINSIPSQNKNWICVYIKAGIYKEQVTIPMDKPFIYLKGEGDRSNVVWDGHGTLIVPSSTFLSLANNTVAESLTFKNSYNHPTNKDGNSTIKPALAGAILGDKSAFYRCKFLGFQDTLFDAQGRHFFKLCTIEGAYDFIFGSAQSIYERCTISVIAGLVNPAFPGFITAQGRENPQDTNGFVFKNCNVIGIGKTYLGRAWRAYSTVVFYNSSFSDIIVPEGWDPWGFAGHEYQLTYAEHDCYGKGSDMSKRVSWEKKLSQKTLYSFTRIGYIDNEGWISRLPIKMLD